MKFCVLKPKYKEDGLYIFYILFLFGFWVRANIMPGESI